MILKQKWNKNDVIELELDMPVQLMQAHPLVEKVFNQVAVKRGPVVYCLESADVPEDVKLAEVFIPADINFKTKDFVIENSKMKALAGQGQIYKTGHWSNNLYKELKPAKAENLNTQLVPYYAWGNRGKGDMSVWLPVTR